MNRMPAYLSREQAKRLLPSSFNGGLKIKKSLDSSEDGDILFYGSKKYEYKNPLWWYSIPPSAVNDVKYILLSLGFYGILLVPIEAFLSYREMNTVRYVKGGREKVTIIQEGKRYIRKESKESEADWTRYFIPYRA